MGPIVLSATYALVADLLATFLAAAYAVFGRHHVTKRLVGVVLACSGGLILGIALLDIIPEAQASSRNNLVVAVGICVGILVMVGFSKFLGTFRIEVKGDEEEQQHLIPVMPRVENHALFQETVNKSNEVPVSLGNQRQRKAKLVSYGIAIHNVPEAFPIGAAVAVSPTLSLSVAVFMMVETFAESGSIAGELIGTKARAGKIFLLTMWPSALSMLGAPIGAILASISPGLLGIMLALAAGIMLFITVVIWSDGRRDAGISWSSVGLLTGVIVALITSTIFRAI